MTEIEKKARESLDNSIPLYKSLSRLELIKFKRANPLPKVESKFGINIEIELWSIINDAELAEVMSAMDIPVTTNSQYTQGTYSKWYMHSDPSIRVDHDKIQKLLQENKYPIKISLQNVQYNQSIPVLGCGRNETHIKEEYIPEDIKKIGKELNKFLIQQKEELIKKFGNVYSTEAFKLVQEKKLTTEVPVENNEDCISETSSTQSSKSNIAYKYSAQPIELSSPTIHNFKDLRKLFYLFKHKGFKRTPLIFIGPSCGLHITFSIPPDLSFSEKDKYIQKLVEVFVSLESQIMDIVPDHRKRNTYCKPLHTHTDLETVIRHSKQEKYSSLYVGKDRGTKQEFRFVNATSNVSEIENWILFLQQVVEYTLTVLDEKISRLHLFDVITHPLLQDWFLTRREFLTTKAKIDIVDSKTLTTTPYLLTKQLRDEEYKRKQQYKLAEKNRAMNSRSYKRESILNIKRSKNAQSARRRVRNGRNNTGN